MAAGGVGYFATGYFHLGYWHVDYWAEQAAGPTGPPTGSLLLMRVGYCFIGLIYGITKWLHTFIQSG